MKNYYTMLLLSLMLSAVIAQEAPLQEAANNSAAIAESNKHQQEIITKQNNLPSNTFVANSNWKTFDKDYRNHPDELFAERKAEFGLSEKDEMLIKSQSTDELAIEHKRYQQYYEGVPVEGGEYILHTDADNMWGNGRLVSGIEASATHLIDEETALQKALTWFGAEIYYWEDASMEALIKDVKNDLNATFYPKGELLFTDENHSQDGSAYYLRWKFDIYAHGEKLRQFVYVDAISGDIAYTKDGLNYCDTEVLANTDFYGEQAIVVDSVSPDIMYLRDCTRGGGIETYDLNNSLSFQYDEPINYLDNPGYGIDAHWSTEMIYDFYLNTYGLNSFDGKGTKMVTLIHFGPSQVSGAFFSGIYTAIGSGIAPFIELVGHEFSHGVSAHTAGLFSFNESGALSESFSNILGTAAEFWALPETASWIFANNGSVGYWMSDPHGSVSPVGTPYPDTYKGSYWLFGGDQNAIVHNNASVQDYCFYLLSDGGTGVNDSGNEYFVESIGIESATDIFFRAYTVYLTGTSQFIDARQASIQSASDLYGTCSNEVEQLINAWYAVGVGPDAYTRDLKLNAIVSPTNNCNLSEEEILTVEVLYNASGCEDIIPAGSEITMSFQLDTEEAVVETWVLDQDFDEGDILSYSFEQTINLPAIANAHELSVWVDYAFDDVATNNMIEAYQVERKYNYDGNLMDFENSLSTNLNTFYVHAGEFAKAVVDTVAKNTGENGFLMSTTNESPSLIPDDPSLNFEYQKELISEICFCVDAQDWENVSLYFDMKQTHSGLYLFIYGNDSTEYLSSMRMLINGEQFGEQFHPETQVDDPFLTHHYSLDQYAGTSFEFCFQSKNYVNDAIDDSPIFSYDTDGDNTYLDNILFVDELFTGLSENDDGNFTIYPNPAKEKIFIAPENGVIPTEINVYNQVGQKVYHQNHPSNTLDISMLEHGIYFIELVSKKSAIREKLIVR